jgi:F0F1-type ATP synthase assembly protein I
VELRDRQPTWTNGFSDALAMSIEFVATPLLFALLGYGLDRWLGTGPWLAIGFGLFGLLGTVLRTYFWYQAEIKREEEGKPWTRSQR